MERNITNIDSLILSFLERTISSGDLQVLRKWVKESAENKAYFQQYEEAWLLSVASTDKKRYHKELAYQNFKEKVDRAVKSKNKMIPLRRILYYAACICLIFMAGIGTNYLLSTSSSEKLLTYSLETPRRAKLKFNLPDGSIVWLNAASTLCYNNQFGITNRDLSLQGEGYFEISKNPELPLVVVSGEAKVKVLGTKFNVHAYAEDKKTTTTLESGSVVVQKANNEDIITLTPNEQLEYDNPSGEFNKKIIDASVYSGWTRGELNFAAMTLSDIFITIERIYDIHIIVPPHLATTDVYTIKFKQKAPIKEIMNIVTKTIGNIDYKVEDENILLIYSPLNKKGGR